MKKFTYNVDSAPGENLPKAGISATLWECGNTLQKEGIDILRHKGHHFMFLSASTLQIEPGCTSLKHPHLACEASLMGSKFFKSLGTYTLARHSASLFDPRPQNPS